MIKAIPISQWLSIPAVRKLRGLALSAVRVLTLSLADDPIASAACLSISLEKGGVSLVYAKRFLSSYKIMHLKTYNFKQGAYPNADEVASAVIMFLNEKGLKAVPVTLCIPKAWTITKVSEFPASVGDDLSAPIQYEMDRLTPFSPEEVFFDYRSLGASEGKVQFILSVTKTDTVKDYLDTLKSNGHIVNRLTSNPSALSALQNFSDRKKGGLKGLADQKDLDLHAVGGAVEALWPDAKALNLLSMGLRETTKKSYVLSALLAAAFMVLLTIFSVAPLWQEKELAGSMDKKINEIKKEALSVEKIRQEIETMEDKVSLIEDFHINETRRIILLKELTKIIPEDTWINRIRIAEDNVELYGYSEAATKLIPKIEASKYFMNVEFASPTMRDARMDMDRFAIKAKAGEK